MSERMYRRPRLVVANNAVDEQREGLGAVNYPPDSIDTAPPFHRQPDYGRGWRPTPVRGLGELPEDLLNDRAIRPPVFSPMVRDFAPGNVPTIGPAPSNMPGQGVWMNPYKFVTYPLNATNTGALKIVTANQRRTYLLLQNKSAGAVFVNFGTNPTPVNSFTVAAGGSLEFIGGADGGAFCPLEDVYVLGTAAVQVVVAGEGYRLPA